MVSLVATVLLPAAVAIAVPAAPASAAEENCSAAAFEPELWTDGWTVNIRGTGIAYCDWGGSAVEVLVKKDVSIFQDPTYGTGVGQLGEWVRANGVCDGNDHGNFYTEVRVADVKVQSSRVKLDCG